MTKLLLSMYADHTPASTLDADVLRVSPALRPSPIAPLPRDLPSLGGRVYAGSSRQDAQSSVLQLLALQLSGQLIAWCDANHSSKTGQIAIAQS